MVIRSPLAFTVGHGLTGPPCPVGESVPYSSGLLIPWLRMTGHKRRPFWMDSLTRPPGWGGRFPGSYNRQGFHHWSCSHACCGQRHGNVHTFGRSYSVAVAHFGPPTVVGSAGLWCCGCLLSESQGSGAPLVRCPSCYGARSYPSRRVQQMTCLSNLIEISKNRRTSTVPWVGVALSLGVSPSDTNNLVAVSGMTSEAMGM